MHTPRSARLALVVLSTIALPCFVHAAVPTAADRRPRSDRAIPQSIQVIDNSKRININGISMVVTNTGSFAYDKSTGGAGLEFPIGTGRTAVFAAGLWLAQESRLAISEYSDEYAPGAMLGTVPDYPGSPEYKVYLLNRQYAETPVRDAALADYNAGAVPHGAPIVSVLDDGSLDILGDQMLWCVYNDADPSRHTNSSGGTVPIGIEVQETVFAYNRPGPLQNTIFIRFKLRNPMGAPFQNMRAALWCDPDDGGFSDDLVGCEPARHLGYAYNSYGVDQQYGSAAPAVGFDLLTGPATSFVQYINGTEPDTPAKTLFAMSGLNADGSPIVDPTNGLPTSFMVSGNVLQGSGWLDRIPADQRLLMGSGPFSIAAGASVELTYALVIGQGANSLESIAQLECSDNAIQDFFDRGFAPPYPDAPACLSITNCVLAAENWRSQCQAGGGEFTLGQLGTIAGLVDTRSTYFAWSADPLANWCGTLGSTATPLLRSDTEREFAALLANAGAAEGRVVPLASHQIYLDPGTPISHPGLAATNVWELIQTARPQLAGAEYLDLNSAHPTPLQGTGYTGLPFGGGAGTGWGLYQSSLNPNTQPDSFMTVELRFDHTQTQLAYRFLRLRTADGGFPNFSPGYHYAGYWPVNLTCWDVAHNEQLEVGYIETAVTDQYGTIQPPGAQPATFDSSWAPDASANGALEHLVVFRRPYSGAPRPEIAQDRDFFFDTPMLYVLAAKLITPADVIDDGDAFRFEWGIPDGPGADALLIHLAGQDITDPAVAQVYADLHQVMSDLNHGIGMVTDCDGTVATLISLVRAEAAPDRVTLAWLVDGDGIASAAIERREVLGPWAAVAQRSPDGTGLIAFEDTDVLAMHRYSYRLRVSIDGAEQVLGETTVEVPAAAMLSLAGFQPNPAGPDLRVAFSLVSRAPARLEIFDLAGRRVHAGNVGALGPGRHVLALGNAVRLPNGAFILRLSQGGRSVTTKALVMR